MQELNGFVRSSFCEFHPASIFIYFSFAVGATMFSNSIWIGCLSIGIAILYNFILKGYEAAVKNIIWMMLIICFTVIFNVIFVHRGETILFYVDSNPITLESIFFGMYMGIKISGGISWFSIFNTVVNGEMIIYVVGRISGLLALMISMVCRYIPILQKRYDEISWGQRFIGCENTKNPIDKIGNIVKKISVLIGWSLEASLDTASSMEARGYGLKRRSSFHMYKFEKRDYYLVIYYLISISLYAFLYLSAIEKDRFYPKLIIGEKTLFDFLMLGIFFLGSISAMIIDVLEDMRWRRL